MSVLTGTVIEGKVVVTGGQLTEGADVYIVAREPNDAAVLSPEERAELDAGLAEADAGHLISEAELLKRLQRVG